MIHKKPINIDWTLSRARYFLEHPDLTLLKHGDSHRKPQLFGALFDILAAYDDLDYGTLYLTVFSGLMPAWQPSGIWALLLLCSIPIGILV